jgi:hypothetical protein
MVYVFAGMRAAASGGWFGAAGLFALGLLMAAVAAGWRRVHRWQWTRHGLAEIQAYVDNQPPGRARP